MNNKAMTFLLGVITALLAVNVLRGGPTKAVAVDPESGSVEEPVDYVLTAGVPTGGFEFRAFVDGTVELTAHTYDFNTCDLVDEGQCVVIPPIGDGRTLVSIDAATSIDGTHRVRRVFSDSTTDLTVVRGAVCDWDTCSWPSNSAATCVADVDHTGEVDFDDLAAVLGDWGTCPPNSP